MILNIILSILYYALWAYQGIIVISIFLTWIPSLMQYKIPRMIRAASDWYMGPFRGFLVLGFIDFTPLIGILIYQGLLKFCISFT